jgi:hypothetical protein
MPQITLEGKFWHKGIAGDPIVILSVFDEGPFREWHKANDVFTQIFEHRDPTSGVDRASIYVAENAVAGIKDGTPVRITVDVRPETRGPGISVLAVNLVG